MDWKKKTLVIYALGGLVCGVLAGVMTINNAVAKKEKVDLSIKDGAKISLAAMDAVRKTVLK